MRQYRQLAAVSVLALALAACGGPAEEEEVTVAEVNEPAASEDAAAEGEVIGEGGEAVEGTEADGEEDAAEGEAEEEEAEELAPEPESSPEPVAAAPVGPPAAFTQCQICHSVDAGQNGIGPSLAGVFGRSAGGVSGFSYTDGMSNSGLTWNEGSLNTYLSDPSGTVPGTTMAIGPLDAAQRAAIIDYLKTL